MKHLCLAFFLSCTASIATADVKQHRKVIGTRTYEGIEVELAVEPVGHGKTLDLRAGETIRFLFSIRDTTTGKPISGLFPAAWVQSRPKGITRKPNYQKMVQAFVGGGLFSQPDIDLNVYHVLALNENNTISVVDPLFGFGGSKLLSMISLPGPGKDWARMTRASKLFVSLPESNQIALIDTSSWQISTMMPQVNHPTRLALQPDEHFLWASLPDGVAVFKTAPFSFQYLFPTGKGPHEMTFTSDNRFTFVANTSDATLTVIDLSTFKICKKLSLESTPSHLAYDPRAEVVYVTHSKTGTISCIDANDHEIYRTISSEPGLGQIRFPPKGRFGFLVNPKTNRLSILDSSRDRIVQSGLVNDAPYEITFSDNFAYIRHRNDATFLLVPLDGANLGKEGAQIPTVEAPGGDAAYGISPRPTPAETVVQAPGANAVLIANPDDQAIYFYKEGMAAPMGQFNNYGQKPRAVAVVDRSLQEKSSPGVYETVGRLEKAGLSDVVFFTDAPRMSLGFELEIGKAQFDPNAPLVVKASAIKPSRTLISGEPIELQFSLDLPSGTPVPKLSAHTFMVSGSWQKRQKLSPDQNGLVTTTITPPKSGHYQVILKSRSPGITIQQKERFIFKVQPSQ